MIKSAEAPDNDNDNGHRKLWVEVIQRAFYKASIGDGISIIFFRSQMFHELCGMLDLPEQRIQQRLASKLKHKPQQAA